MFGSCLFPNTAASRAACSMDGMFPASTPIQSGFPIRITSSSDNELMYSAFFEYPGEPDQIAPFRTLNPKSNGGYWFDSTEMQRLHRTRKRPARTESIGHDCSAESETQSAQSAVARRSITSISRFTRCCLSEEARGKRFEFRSEFFNLFNHTQFNNPDGNITDGSDFGRIKRAREPRLIQLAIKFYF